MKKQADLGIPSDDNSNVSIGILPRREGLPIRTVDAHKLFDKEVEIGIIHGDSLYRLRITRGGKLILNK